MPEQGYEVDESLSEGHISLSRQRSDVCLFALVRPVPIPSCKPKGAARALAAETAWRKAIAWRDTKSALSRVEIVQASACFARSV